MNQLIDDLLAFSRVGRHELKKMPVDMERLAQDVLSELTRIKKAEGLSLIVQGLPQAHADPALIRQVWVNLLSNAIKFSSKTENPTIEVAGGTADHEHVYSVKDNGAGFDMMHRQKLFGVFQRLHDAKEFEGTGVGLAIVQRIIERHGGRIWAEATLGKGATFYFSLPRNEGE